MTEVRILLESIALKLSKPKESVNQFVEA